MHRTRRASPPHDSVDSAQPQSRKKRLISFQPAMAAFLSPPQRRGVCLRCELRCPAVDDLAGAALLRRKIDSSFYDMITEVAHLPLLTPTSARLAGNAARALSALVPMADLMDTEEAVDTLDFVAKEMATRAEKRKKEDEEQAALEQAASLVRGQARAAKRAAIGARLPRE